MDTGVHDIDMTEPAIKQRPHPLCAGIALRLQCEHSAAWRKPAAAQVLHWLLHASEGCCFQARELPADVNVLAQPLNWPALLCGCGEGRVAALMAAAGSPLLQPAPLPPPLMAAPRPTPACASGVAPWLQGVSRGARRQRRNPRRYRKGRSVCIAEQRTEEIAAGTGSAACGCSRAGQELCAERCKAPLDRAGVHVAGGVDEGHRGRQSGLARETSIQASWADKCSQGKAARKSPGHASTGTAVATQPSHEGAMELARLSSIHPPSAFADDAVACGNFVGPGACLQLVQVADGSGCKQHWCLEGAALLSAQPSGPFNVDCGGFRHRVWADGEVGSPGGRRKPRSAQARLTVQEAARPDGMVRCYFISGRSSHARIQPVPDRVCVRAVCLRAEG
jgi:hypothetical protein